MKRRFAFALLLALATLAGGCALPHNTPGHHLDHIRPVISPRRNVLPPAAMLMHPGPGVDGPGPGVFMTANPAAGVGLGLAGATSQVGFISPEGMHVTWDVGAPGMFDSEPLIVPGRYNFGQGAIYRLKLTEIPGERRAGIELYPTLEIAPATPRTEAFLAHSYIPFQITDEDLDQVLSGNFVTKVIYLPDPEHQELALAGVETLVSTRLDPGVDPIVEADRRGSILAIIRLGNKDLQVADGTPGGFSTIGGGALPPGVASTGLPMGGAGGLGAACGPDGAFGGGGVNNYVAGMTVPQYGMPYVGTPIGLPGPPHIPLGVPAGLQKHVVKNHTHYHIPGPVEKVKIDVKQTPGLSYPKPVDHVHIHERSYVPPIVFHQPFADHHHNVGQLGNAGAVCPICGGNCGGTCESDDAH
jgi:hypothetical protein